jgi:hypothetical protein
MELITKPDYAQCVDRIEAWFRGEMLDRVPIRFHRHNAEFDVSQKSSHATLKDRWFDAEYQVDEFIRSISGMRFNAETFPIYAPNLGPNVYAAFHGGEMTFGDNTSWYHEIISDYETDLAKIRFSKDNIYYKKILELTEVALQKCGNRFLVGYTDIHPGLDCALAWRGTNNLCLDLVTDPDHAQKLFDLASEHFLEVYNGYDEILKAHRMPSCTWLNIPVPNGRMHVPSADFSFMISSDDYEKYGLPILREEVKTMTHNVYHVDGKGVANHIDIILSVPEVRGIQWVQGVGDDYPIMQHLDFIRYIQSRDRGIIVDLAKEDLDEYMERMSPKNTFLWIATESEEEEIAIIKKLTKWKVQKLY